MNRYKILRANRAAIGCPPVGTIVYDGRDSYGCASDDSRDEGIEFTACCVNESGEPFFTIPKADIEKLEVE